MKIGRVQELPVWVLGAAGALLGDRSGHALLPTEEVPEGIAVGDTLRVFVYTDTHDEPAATLRTPKGTVGDFVCLEVVGVSDHGAFCDWGLEKDLFIPWKRQHTRLGVGDRAVVAIGVDRRTGRPVGSTWLASLLEPAPASLRVGQQVGLLVYGSTDAGTRVIVNQRWSGLVFHDAVTERLKLGEERTGWVTRIRDGRLDCALTPPGHAGRDHACAVVWEALERGGGHLELGDHSPAGEIRAVLGLSKKAFKRALGQLYRERRVTLGPDGVRIAEP